MTRPAFTAPFLLISAALSCSSETPRPLEGLVIRPDRALVVAPGRWVTVEGIGVFTSDSRDRSVSFPRGTTLRVDGRPVAPPETVSPDEVVVAELPEGRGRWEIRTHDLPGRAPIPGHRVLEVVEEAWRNVDFQAGEPARYELIFERGRGSAIHGYSPLAVLMGVKFRSGRDGLEVHALLIDSPAEAAGLRLGDLISSVDGTAITLAELPALLERREPGDVLHLDVRRGGTRLQTSLVLGVNEAIREVWRERPAGT